MSDLDEYTKTDRPPVRRCGLKHIHTFPDDEPFKQMIEFKGVIFVATTKDIYELQDGELIRLRVNLDKCGEDAFDRIMARMFKVIMEQTK